MEHRDSGMLDLELCREIEERRLRRRFVERTRAAKGAAVGERSPSSLAPMVVARIVCTKRRQTQIPFPLPEFMLLPEKLVAAASRHSSYQLPPI